MNFKLIGVLILLVLLVVFVLQNAEVVAVRLLFWDVSMSRAILILITTIAGFICGFLVAKLSGTSSNHDA